MYKLSPLETLAKGLKHGGAIATYNFPGFHSHELFSLLGGNITSVNEKIAYEMAWGNSQAGRPAVVTFKNVGLNDAADPFINSLLTGVGAGLVLVVFDDIELEGSQCILDSRHYYNFFGGLWLEPYDLVSTARMSEAAVTLSSLFNIPVVIRLTNKFMAHTQNTDSSFPTVEDIIDTAKKCLAKAAVGQLEPIVHPMNANAQRNRLKLLEPLLQSFSNEFHSLINIEALHDKIYVGYTQPDATAHITTLPTPDISLSGIHEVNEIGDAVVSSNLASKKVPLWHSNLIGYNLSNASRVIVSARYERLFSLLQPRFDAIIGDLGEYTKDSLNTLTHCLCFGSCISVASGMKDAGINALAVSGDASFFHSGKNVLPETLLRGTTPKIVLLDNHGSQGTGGQSIPGELPDTVTTIVIDYDTVSDAVLSETVEKFIKLDTPVMLRVLHTSN